jgi:hypothetical protein
VVVGGSVVVVVVVVGVVLPTTNAVPFANRNVALESGCAAHILTSIWSANDADRGRPLN